MNDNDNHEIMTIDDVAKELKISYTKARLLVHEHIKHIKIGRTYRITRSSFNQFLGMSDESNTDNIHYELNPY
jgi:excisionase family DNA binding protein